MDFLLKGTGADIHAAAWKLMESRRTGNIYSITRNAGIETLCICVSDDFAVPEDMMVIDLGKVIINDEQYTEIPCFLSGGELYPVCVVSVNGDRADVTPWDVDINKVFGELQEKIEIPEGYGIYSIFTDIKRDKAVISKGLGEFGGVTALPVLRGDLAKMLNDCKNGRKPEFKVVNNCSVIRKHSKPGQKVKGLSTIPGSAGVFINACRYDNGMITTGDVPLYIASRGDTKEKSAEALSMAEKYITFED